MTSLKKIHQKKGITTKNPQLEEEINKFIGNRIRAVRLSFNLTKVFVAKQLGITYQQLSNYENATSSITVERLYIIATIFNAPLLHFLPTHKDIAVDKFITNF